MQRCVDWSLLQWIVTKLPDGNYTLVVESSGRIVYIKDDDGKLVGSDTPPPFQWAIVRQSDDSYTSVPIYLLL